jgi:hypothetical protein
LKKKLLIIGKGVSTVALSKELGVFQTTINDMNKNASDIEYYASQMEDYSHAKKQKTMKKAGNIVLDEALYLWFVKK